MGEKDIAMRQCVEELFNLLDIEHNQEMEEQFTVLMACMKLYADRDKEYGSVWKQYGALSNLSRGATKVDRLMEMWWHKGFNDTSLFHKNRLDDAYDLINYIVFFIRCARNGDLTGSPIKRTRYKEESAASLFGGLE
jgi:hypothetical protein